MGSNFKYIHKRINMALFGGCHCYPVYINGKFKLIDF